jgi:hypothetical protein
MIDIVDKVEYFNQHPVVYEPSSERLEALNSIPDGIKLEVREAALIFQCDNFLSMRDEERKEWLASVTARGIPE